MRTIPADRLTVRIAGRRITLRAVADRPGRQWWGAAQLAPSLQPDPNAGVLRRPLPVRGNDLPTTAPESRRLINPAQSASRDGKGGGSLPSYPTPLDLGLPPQRIRRLTQAADRGAVGPGTGQRVTGQLGYNARTDGSTATIPHIRIPRTPITVTAFRRTIDTTSSIPARGIGAPVR